ncbi:glycine oxidase ThiO [Motiliproteus sp. SC1-56]|uniref:glycine oxidase ThiO n=1 Tax=Motiliproteus sp. SC1-56 TaxID=2799565 RepID=UPI001A8F658D|nr:glycine oxidase ThiO [Motiliproteus sp. SC1-56]
MKQADVIVVGGGVMGLLTARELAAAGARVRVLDKGPLVGEASWAGGGIVSPLYPWRYSEAVTALASWSQGCYERLCEALIEEAGISPELRQKGLLMLAVEDAAEALSWAQAHQRPLAPIDADDIYRLEPRLPPGLERALWMPEVASVRNPRLGQALQRSLSRNPRVKLEPGTPVERFRVQGGRVAGVETPEGCLCADQVLITAGAWSGELLAGLGLSLPVEPVRGQMLLFNTPGDLIDRVILRDGRYLIPRNDGRILVGSTLEYTGFDKAPTEPAYHSLKQSALTILPALQDCPVEAQWAGLRPGAPGGVPYIGRLAPFENLFINAGHFRNGLVLAPAACRLAADLLLDRSPLLDPASYSLEALRPEAPR